MTGEPAQTPQGDNVVSLRGRAFAAQPPTTPVAYGGGSGGTSGGGGPTMTDISREEVDAKLGRIGAETDTKIARIEGVLGRISDKLDHVLSDNVETRAVIRSEQGSTRANVWVVGVGLAGIILALAVAFPTFFGMGAQVHDTAVQAAKEAVQQAIHK